MEVKTKKGQGMIGVLLIMLITIMVFTLLYIILDNLIQNQLTNMVDDAGSIARFNEMIKPVWTTIPVFFGLSIVLWALVVASGNMGSGWSIFGSWMIILVSFAVFDIIYVNFDPWVMTELPTMIEHQQSTEFYQNMVVRLWVSIPWFFNGIMILFAVFMASTMFESWSRNVPRY
jgi:hypothetical protein